MTYDQNRKTLRHFQCRDYLWDIFERMSAELECSTDYLINEAMRQYARSRNYSARSSSSNSVPRLSAPPPPPPRSERRSSPVPPAPPSSSRPPNDGFGPPQSMYPSERPRYGAGGGSFQPAPGSGRYGAAPPGASMPPGATLRPPGRVTPPPLPPSPQGRSSRPPPQVRAPQISTSSPPPPIFVIFNGQKIPILKPEYVIGRGSKTADLPIRDGNISRRHAVVVFQEGQWQLRDLGSTNGVEFNGHRVDAKSIDEGDTFYICDYELRFTYH